MGCRGCEVKPRGCVTYAAGAQEAATAGTSTPRPAMTTGGRRSESRRGMQLGGAGIDHDDVRPEVGCHLVRREAPAGRAPCTPSSPGTSTSTMRSGSFIQLVSALVTRRVIASGIERDRSPARPTRRRVSGSSPPHMRIRLSMSAKALADERRLRVIRRAAPKCAGITVPGLQDPAAPGPTTSWSWGWSGAGSTCVEVASEGPGATGAGAGAALVPGPAACMSRRPSPRRGLAWPVSAAGSAGRRRRLRLGPGAGVAGVCDSVVPEFSSPRLSPEPSLGCPGRPDWAEASRLWTSFRRAVALTRAVRSSRRPRARAAAPAVLRRRRSGSRSRWRRASGTAHPRPRQAPLAVGGRPSKLWPRPARNPSRARPRAVAVAVAPRTLRTPPSVAGRQTTVPGAAYEDAVARTGSRGRRRVVPGVRHPPARAGEPRRRGLGGRCGRSSVHGGLPSRHRGRRSACPRRPRGRKSTQPQL